YPVYVKEPYYVQKTVPSSVYEHDSTVYSSPVSYEDDRCTEQLISGISGKANMKAFVVFSVALMISSAVALDESAKEKRGIYDFGSAHESYESYEHQPLNYGYTKKEIITKKVTVPYPVEVEKHVPVPVKVPYPVKVEKEVPFVVEKKVPVYIEKKAFIVFSMALAIACATDGVDSKKEKRGLWDESYDNYGYDNYGLGYSNYA
uniref:Uncharacterized protein n=1 Tax=Anopheles culicifacies TaxID=139723 RepID=A0A182M0J7_9DIPT